MQGSLGLSREKFIEFFEKVFALTCVMFDQFTLYIYGLKVRYARS